MLRYDVLCPAAAKRKAAMMPADTPKIIFLDVDGTLVDYENNLPDSAVGAIREARANGHRIYICTGRSKAEVYPPLWEIGLDGMIGGNGSYVESDGEIVMHRTLSLDQCTRAVDWLDARGLAFYLESNSGLFASRDFENGALEAVRAYSARKGKTNADTMTVHDGYPDMIYGGELYRDDVNKISYVLGSQQDFLDAEQEFDDMHNGTWGGRGATALWGDLGVKDITKAHAIDCLLAYLGADRADTIAFGDAAVDVPMLEYCAYGVAMGNGSPDVKRAADLVTDDVEEDGLAHAFARLGLIGRRTTETGHGER